MLRFELLHAASAHTAVTVDTPSELPSSYFARNVFTKDKMAHYLQPDVYAAMVDVIDHGAVIDRAIADDVADGMRRWAMELGATHYTHWFHPLTDTTAEKHDSFLDPDGHGGLIETLSGKLLAQQEPDASSFPNGGIRATFEARGYSAWDPTSPAFVMDDTLCIPTIFIAYTGEALDYKAPLLRALHAVDEASVAVCRYFDPSVRRVTSFLGWEQEYFLVDESVSAARQDITLTGRTLVGHASAKDQQLGDHYLGAIPERAAAFMKDLQIEALRLGIPIKTCHNEVAPNQFEFAPIFEETNLACDHNMLLMTLMKQVAHRHGLVCLLHEKPFHGINGSGKHCNFSLQVTDGDHLRNLMAPGHSDDDNLLFITFVVNTLAAVYRHNALLKASIMSASNAARLGGHEAPPAIISSFVGRQLTQVLDALEGSDDPSALHINGKHGRSLHIPQIPELLIDDTDRNRTSPFAFNGNRFEFRAVGSEANCACTMIVLTSAVAEQLRFFRTAVDARTVQGEPLREAIVAELRALIAYSKPIRFDGNGYSAEWAEEAARRGLDCQTSAPLIFDAYTAPASIQMFESLGVMRRAELEARNEIKWETYVKKVQIESRVMNDMAENHIVPAALEYKRRLADTLWHLTDSGHAEWTADEQDLIATISQHVGTIRATTVQMRAARKEANHIADLRQRAIAYEAHVLPLMATLRKSIDKLEEIVDDNLWPLPKYRELLFMQ